MRRRPFKLGAAGACVAVSLLAGAVVAYAASGSPEIDRANATLLLAGKLAARACAGEDATDYVTYHGTWKGAETQMFPDVTDSSLTGAVTVGGIRWTVNSQTRRGLLTGRITLTSAVGNATVYAGTLTLVTQGVPAAGTNVSARGWISAPIVANDEGVGRGDDSLVANVEMSITTTGATGEFGDLPTLLGVPAYSVIANATKETC